MLRAGHRYRSITHTHHPSPILTHTIPTCTDANAQREHPAHARTHIYIYIYIYIYTQARTRTLRVYARTLRVELLCTHPRRYAPYYYTQLFAVTTNRMSYCYSSFGSLCSCLTLPCRLWTVCVASTVRKTFLNN